MNKLTTLDNPKVEMLPYEGQFYQPVKPQPDTEQLMERCRVILYHKSAGCGDSTARLMIAPKGLLCAGFVIGLIRE